MTGWLIGLSIVAAVWLLLKPLDRLARSGGEQRPGDVPQLARSSCAVAVAIVLAVAVGLAALLAMGAAGL